MNLISCEECGVVLNQDNVKLEPAIIHHSDDPNDWSYHPDTHWINDEPHRVFKCPVCKEMGSTNIKAED